MRSSSSFREMVWPNRLMLQALGFTRLTTHDSLTFANFRLGISIVALGSLVGPQIYSLAYYWGDIDYLAETSGLAMVFSLMLYKLLYMTARRREFGRVYGWIKLFWRLGRDAAERETYLTTARLAKRVSIVALAAGLASYAATVGVALLAEAANLRLHYRQSNGTVSHRRLLPLNLVYGFEYEATPLFECVFVGQAVSLVTVVAVGTGGDASVLSAALHLIGQFRLVNHRLRAIGSRLSSDAYFAEVTTGNVRWRVRECIKHHQLVVRVADKFTKLISPMVLGQLLGSGLQICISSYTLVEGSVRGVVFVKNCVILASVMIQLMMWFVPGDFLDEESGRVAASVCHELPWSSLPTSLRRDLLFVMLRAQKTCKVVAVYQVTNVAKITEVVKAAGSYMAVLRSFK